MDRSNSLDDDIARVRSESLQIVRVRCEHRSTRLGDRNDKCINGGALAGLCPQMRGSPRQPLRDVLDDIARLQQLVCQRVPSSISMKRLDHHRGGHNGRPKPFGLQRNDQRS